jgi:hypothetical protein
MMGLDAEAMIVKRAWHGQQRSEAICRVTSFFFLCARMQSRCKQLATEMLVCRSAIVAV